MTSEPRPTDEPSGFLAATAFVNADHPAVADFAQRYAGQSDSDIGRAVALYYAVRDGFRYDPYQVNLSVAGLCASGVLERGHGWCVSKSVLLAAACRAVGIPARMGYADVRNHLATERMRRVMKTDVFYYHGYTSIYLGGRWLKATSAFNIGLCEKFGLVPLEFDGTADSIYHPFDQRGNRHMEYLNFRGEYFDVPLDDIRTTFLREYPAMFDQLAGGDFDSEVNAEAGVA